jgi:hypothetical protein
VSFKNEEKRGYYAVFNKGRIKRKKLRVNGD